MGEIDRISDQMTRAFEGDAWHGPSLSEVLDGVDALAAAAKPVSNGHSIWEIVLHLIGTQDLMLDRVQGREKELTPDEDWPRVPPTSEKEWAETVRKLKANDERLRQLVSAIDDSKLEAPLVEGGSTAYIQLHGYIQHNLYHAGQIAILKKHS